MKYRREIDGLRAVAVLPVILFHAGIETFRGGFVGVDVFFVISGYLITSIVLSETQAGSFTLARFYERRARRILPPLFLVAMASWPLAWLWLTPRDFMDFSLSLAAVAVFGSNVLFWKQSGYFDTAAELKPLLHTWSLSVEEQFYLVFPLLLRIAWRLGRSAAGAMILVVGAASLAAAQWTLGRDPAAAFFLLPTRAWELMVGGAIALYHNGKALDAARHRHAASAGTLLGLAMIAYAVVVFDKDVPFPGLHALVPTLGAALIVLCAFPNTVAGPLLGNSLLVGTGLISYSLYLWHFPLFVFARHKSPAAPPTSTLGALCLAALLLAYVSWRFVERPVRDAKRTRRWFVVLMAITGTASLLGAGYKGYVTRGFMEERITQPQRDVMSSLRRNPRLGECHTDKVDLRDPKELCTYNPYDPTWVIYGDSHVIELAHALAEVLNERHIGLRQYSLSGPPCCINADNNFEFPVVWNRNVVRYINATPSLHTVVVTYRIHSHLFGEHNGIFPAVPNLKTPKGREDMWAALVLVLRGFVQAGKKVIFVLQAPEVSRAVDALIYRERYDPRNITGVTRDWWNRRSAFVTERLSDLPREVIVVDPAELFCERDACAAVRDGRSLYVDDNHMSLHGAGIVAREIVRVAGER